MNITISNSTKLTPATKAKLEALGVDTTNIKTEAEGQRILKIVEAKQEEVQKTHISKGVSSATSIRAEATQLASEVGVSVSNDDKIDNILSKISDKINELRINIGNDQSKLAQINKYQSQLEAISSEFSNMQTSKIQLSNGMNALASYNKIYQNLR